jgi:hypothetical protein
MNEKTRAAALFKRRFNPSSFKQPLNATPLVLFQRNTQPTAI